MQSKRTSPTAGIPRRRALSGIISLAALLLLPGCEDKAEKLGPQGPKAIEFLATLIERDVKQVREGLPKGAAAFAKLMDDDPAANPSGLRRWITKSRANVHDLVVAKSTFFIFIDPAGVVVRGEADPDLAAGESLADAVPAVKAALSKGEAFDTFGQLKGLRGVNTGPELQWLVGHPLKDKDQKLKGAFVTGWSLRKYAAYLEDHTRNEVKKNLGGKGPAPLLYVLILKGDHAYGSPVTPDVNAEAVAKAGIRAKTAGGELVTTRVKVEAHEFLVVAKASPTIAADAAVAVMFSLL